MKILSIARYVVTRNLRNISVMLIMCAMPLLIIFVLGVAFEGAMSSDGNISIGDMYIHYMVDGEATELTTGFEEFTKNISEDIDITKVDDFESEINSLKLNEITALVVVDENNDEIKMYKNSVDDTESSLFEGMLRTYINRYNVIMEIVRVNPMALQQILDKDVESASYTAQKSIGNTPKPSSMDYYGIAMIVLFSLYGALTPMFDIMHENESGLTDRMTTSNIRGGELFAGNMLGFVTITAIQSIIVIVISYLAFDINWGSQPIYPLLTILSLIICMSSFGVFIGSTVKNPAAANPIMHVFIVATAFFGGAYVPTSQLGSLGEVGRYFSTVWWGNTAIQKSIYGNDNSYLVTANIIFLSAALVLTVINSTIFRKRRMR